MQSQAAAPAQAGERERLAAAAHRLKNQYYGAIVRAGRLPLRPGVAQLLKDCRQRRCPAWASRARPRAATSRHCCVRTSGADWALRFATVMCAEDAPNKKPDPLRLQARAAPRWACPPPRRLRSRMRRQASRPHARAGIAVVVTRSHYFPDTARCAGAGRRAHARRAYKAGTRTRSRRARASRWHRSPAGTPVRQPRHADLPNAEDDAPRDFLPASARGYAPPGALITRVAGSILQRTEGALRQITRGMRTT